MSETLSAEAFADIADVSRETLERLKIYADLLGKWNRRVNLIGKSTVGDIWRRHMLDSAQLRPHLPAAARKLVDLGSGAGFPGLVLAVMGAPDVHLIEANERKCAFLREAARLTETPVTIHNTRIGAGGHNARIGAGGSHHTQTDAAEPGKADIVTARALAPLPLLLDYAEPYLAPSSICFFLKGQGVNDELTEAYKTWNIRDSIFSSLTDPQGAILRLEAISRDPSH